MNEPLTLEQAITLSENPVALARWRSDDELRQLLAEIDRLFDAAERERPLVWQAFRARAARRDAVDVVDVPAHARDRFR